MSTHTIQDELTQLANHLGIDVSGSHNIKDVIRKMSESKGGNSNGQAIADAIKNLKQVLPFAIADAPTVFTIANVPFTFDDDVYSYLGTVSGEAESGELTFTAASGTTAAITFNGDTVTTGDTLEFVNGANVLVATVFQDDVAPVTYTVTFPFQRVAKDLTALAVANVTFDPTFSGSTYEYAGTASTSYYSGALTITPQANNTVVATFNGDTVESGDTLDFVDGDNTITVTVSREDSADKVYEVVFGWEQPYADELTALAITNVTLTPTLGTGVYEYAGAIGEGETSGTITWTAASGTTVAATFNGTAISYGDELTFADGSNTVVLTVSKAHTKDLVYTITIPNSES